MSGGSEPFLFSSLCSWPESHRSCRVVRGGVREARLKPGDGRAGMQAGAAPSRCSRGAQTTLSTPLGKLLACRPCRPPGTASHGPRLPDPAAPLHCTASWGGHRDLECSGATCESCRHRVWFPPLHPDKCWNKPTEKCITDAGSGSRPEASGDPVSRSGGGEDCRFPTSGPVE